MKKPKHRPKIECEVCGEKDIKVLDRHHIIPRTDPRCTNDDYNLAILCSSCHRKVHAGKIKIIGVFPGTKPPSGLILVYEINEKANVEIEPEIVEDIMKNRN